MADADSAAMTPEQARDFLWNNASTAPGGGPRGLGDFGDTYVTDVPVPNQVAWLTDHTCPATVTLLVLATNDELMVIARTRWTSVYGYHGIDAHYSMPKAGEVTITTYRQQSLPEVLSPNSDVKVYHARVLAALYENDALPAARVIEHSKQATGDPQDLVAIAEFVRRTPPTPNQ